MSWLVGSRTSTFRGSVVAMNRVKYNLIDCSIYAWLRIHEYGHFLSTHHNLFVTRQTNAFRVSFFIAKHFRR